MLGYACAWLRSRVPRPCTRTIKPLLTGSGEDGSEDQAQIPNRDLTTPGTGHSWTARCATLEAHSQSFSNEYVPDITAIDTKNATDSPKVAGISPLCCPLDHIPPVQLLLTSPIPTTWYIQVDGLAQGKSPSSGAGAERVAIEPRLRVYFT